VRLQRRKTAVGTLQESNFDSLRQRNHDVLSIIIACRIIDIWRQGKQKFRQQFTAPSWIGMKLDMKMKNELLKN
jgi:hypothetical protein